MKLSAVMTCLVAVVATSWVPEASAVIVQTGADVLDGRPYLYVEGEAATTFNAPVDGLTWKIAAKGGPDMSGLAAVPNGQTPLPIVPTTSNVSGSAIYAPTNDFSINHNRTAIYHLKFITAGTYQFYLRQSLYDSNNNNSFLNEDSIFLPPAFNKNSGLDWIGFNTLTFDDESGDHDIPTPGYALDPDGWEPQVGDHERDGLLELANWGIKDEGTVVLHTPSGTLSSNGNFNWYNRPAYQGTKPPVNTFDGFFGLKNEFIVSEAMVGQTVTFELGLREFNVAIDGMLFINMGTPADIYPNSDLLDLYSQAEIDAAILPDPLLGDYNNNGVVDTADYILWRKAGSLQNEADTPGTVNAADYTEWRARFGNPSAGSGLGGGTVPEPTTAVLALLAGIATVAGGRRRP